MQAQSCRPSLIKFLGLRSRDGLDCPLPVWTRAASFSWTAC